MIASAANRLFNYVSMLRFFFICFATFLSTATSLAQDIFDSRQDSDNAKTAIVAVATNFAKTFKALEQRFERNTPYSLTASFGSTGQLYAQIVHGAPFHIFLAADSKRPQQLIDNNAAESDSYHVYAQGQLALFSTEAIENPKTLLMHRTVAINKLAIANPKLAPYGQAAIETLQHLDVLATWQNHLITGQNVAQTYQFISTGNVALGFVAYSQLIDTRVPKSHYWIIPKHYHQPIEQAAVLLTTGKTLPAARAFLDFLQSPEGIAIIQRHGYLTDNTE